jgi:sugar phosphate isomerase/epimerase
VPRTAHDLTWPDLIWSHFSRPRFGGFDERVGAAAEAGFDAVGLYALEYQRMRQEEGRSAADIRAVVEDHGLVVAEIEVVRGWSDPPGEASPQCASLEEIAYEMADELGCRYLQAVGSYEGTVEDAARGFAALCDRAAAHDLVVGIEFLPFTNIKTAADVDEILDLTDRPNAGCCVDIWHHVRGANDWAQLEALPLDRIVSVQFDDGPRLPIEDDYTLDTITNRTVPGDGEMDLARFLRTVHPAASKLPLSLEVIDADLLALPVAEAAQRIADATRAVLARPEIASR